MRSLLPSRRATFADVATAAALLVVSVLERFPFDERPVIGAAAVITMTAPVAVRRRAPAAAAFAFAGGLLVESALVAPAPSAGSMVTALVIAYSLAAQGQGGRAASAAVAMFVAVVAFLVLDPETNSPLAALPTIVLLAGAAGIGVGVRRRFGEARVAAASATAAERRRIARELHDLVGHGVGLMVVQASTGRVALDRNDYTTARSSLEAIERAGREALAELRLLLGLLRAEEAERDGGDLVPQPGLDAIAALIDHLADSGHNVELTIEGEPAPVPASVALSAYRIVQEALTNVVKHARGAPTNVRLRYAPTALHVEVIDRGPGTTDANVTGYGLIGMHERASLHGGSVEAGNTSAGGFAVRALLPLAAP